MPGGSARTLSQLPEAVSNILEEARRGTLVTIDQRARAHAVPVCYVVRNDRIVTPIDAKPKSGKTVARRKNVEMNGTATFLVDRWSEDWSRLGWVMARGTALVEPVDRFAKEELEARYPQYGGVDLGDDAIVIAPDDIVWWSWE